MTETERPRRIRVAPDLQGWDAVAGALGCSVRTAQRYAQRAHDPLPVRRLFGRQVVARSAQLEGWVERNMRAA